MSLVLSHTVKKMGANSLKTLQKKMFTLKDYLKGTVSRDFRQFSLDQQNPPGLYMNRQKNFLRYLRKFAKKTFLSIHMGPKSNLFSKKWSENLVTLSL